MPWRVRVDVVGVEESPVAAACKLEISVRTWVGMTKTAEWSWRALLPRDPHQAIVLSVVYPNMLDCCGLLFILVMKRV